MVRFHILIIRNVIGIIYGILVTFVTIRRDALFLKFIDLLLFSEFLQYLFDRTTPVEQQKNIN